MKQTHPTQQAMFIVSYLSILTAIVMLTALPIYMLFDSFMNNSGFFDNMARNINSVLGMLFTFFCLFHDSALAVYNRKSRGVQPLKISVYKSLVRLLVLMLPLIFLLQLLFLADTALEAIIVTIVLIIVYCSVGILCYKFFVEKNILKIRR